jgi:hypothetical protein
MGYLESEYTTWKTEELVEERKKIETDIEENDGRLTTGSSAQLDYDLDKLDAIDFVLKQRI